MQKILVSPSSPAIVSRDGDELRAAYEGDYVQEAAGGYSASLLVYSGTTRAACMAFARFAHAQQRRANASERVAARDVSSPTLIIRS